MFGKNFIFKTLFCVSTILIFTSCASDPKPKTKAHPSTWINDYFVIDQGMPVREVQEQKFFYKKCEMDGRNAYTSRIEYSCDEKF